MDSAASESGTGRERVCDQFNKRWRLLSDWIAAIRLSLPARYLDPKRNTSLGESKSFHTRRLVNLLEISLAALLMSMPKSLEPADHASWRMDWDVCNHDQ
jgi:hypothetical protein